MIMAFLHAERQRRETKLAAAPKTNRYGATVAGESRWYTHDPQTGTIGSYGEPIEHLWDEFHDQAKDLEFLATFVNMVRLQRAAGIGATLITQGGGLADIGDGVLRDLAAQTSRTMYRTSEMSARMAGGRNQDYSTADLPPLPGMCLREAPDSPKVPLRAAYITRDADAEDTVYTTLWGKGSTPVLQIEDPVTWIAPETIQIMKDTGVWDMWMQARDIRPDGSWTPNVARLLADDEEDEEDEVQAAMAITTMPPKAIRPATAPTAAGRMPARDVVLAILHLYPGSSLQDIYTSEVWSRAPGWGKPPAKETVSRAATRELDPTVGGTQPLPPGAVQKVDRGPKSASWRVLPVAEAEAAAAVARLLPPPPQPTAPGARPASVPAGMSPAALAEMIGQQASELAAEIQEEMRMAWRG